MKTEKYGTVRRAVCTLLAFVLWTVLVCLVDVCPIGPGGSCVGFAAVNGFVHDLTGVHWMLYTLTDWLSLIPLMIAAGFALLGLKQWVQRGRIRKVDPEILLLGGFYLTVMGLYAFFELFTVNYRPVLINGFLEASYPSSTTMLVVCVMQTAAMQVKTRNRMLKKAITGGITGFTIFMVMGRLLSGVHWFTDIVGGVLLGRGLVMLYCALHGKLR